MELIVGGAYQGKLDYAIETFGLDDEDIYICADNCEPDFSVRCIGHLELYILYCVRKGKAPEFKFRKDAVIICDDIFCGVVPTDKVERAWREETGRALGRITRASEHVTRVFCGLPQKLK